VAGGLGPGDLHLAFIRQLATIPARA